MLWFRRSAATGLVAILVLSAASCAGEQVASESSTPVPVGSEPSPLPTPTRVVQYKDGASADGRKFRAAVSDLYRHGRFVTVDLALVNRAPQPLDIGTELSRSGDEEDISGVSLRDSAGHRYFPARYAGECYCSYDTPVARNGQTLYLTATYLIPRSKAKTFDLSVPGVGTFSGVPVGGSPAERPVVAAPPGLPEPVANRVVQPFGIAPEGGYSLSRAFVVLSVYGVYRREGQAIVLMGLSLRGDVPHEGIGSGDYLLGARGGTGGATGVTLVDPMRGRAYRVASDADGECLCSADSDISAYATTVVGAVFAAPPASARRVDVALPHFGVVPGVPVRQGGPPEPDAASPLPRSGFDSVTTADPVSSNEAANLPVVTVTAG